MLGLNLQSFLEVIAPTVRLAAICALMQHNNEENCAKRYPFHKANAPTIRLAHCPGAQGDNCLRGKNDSQKLPEASAPALLVSFFYLEDWLKRRSQYIIRDWVLDSGAYSARNSGADISLDKYIDTCKRLIDEEEQLTEIFSLDVIGDWKATKRNTEKMWKAGVPAIPCFHLHEPWDYLKCIARDYPKIAIGGMADLRGKAKGYYVDQCFARTWPKPIHGFGAGSRDLVLRVPWHSTDATSWELGACGFGRWRAFGKMSVRGSQQNLRAEVEFYLRLEREARSKWERAMEEPEVIKPLREQAAALV